MRSKLTELKVKTEEKDKKTEKKKVKRGEINLRTQREIKTEN